MSIYTMGSYSVIKNKNKSSVICKKMDISGEHHVEQNKPDLERQMLHDLLICEILKDDMSVEGTVTHRRRGVEGRCKERITTYYMH